MLPTSKMLTVPSPGRIGSTNSFPATMVLSPDGRYAALLNDGYGTQETLAHQSIAVLDLKSNQIADYPDARLSDEVLPELLPRSGIQFGWQASVRLGGFADRSHGSEAWQHGKWHCRLPLHRRQSHARALHPYRAAAAIDGEETGRWPEGAAPHGDSVPRGTGCDCRRRPGQTSDREQSFRQRCAARSRDRKNSADLRSQHQRSRAVFVSLYLCGHARWPPRLVQLVECLASGGTGSDERQSRPLDQAEAAGRPARSGLASHRDAAESG